MTYNYAYQGDEVQAAKAVGVNLPISTKTATMIANFIRGKSVTRVRADLEAVLGMKIAVPFTRFTDGVGHRPGIGAGRYPQKATKEILAVVNAAVANAQDKGLSDELVIASVTANQGMKRPKYGRHRGRQAKATHVEVVVKEQQKEKQDGN